MNITEHAHGVISIDLTEHQATFDGVLDELKGTDLWTKSVTWNETASVGKPDEHRDSYELTIDDPQCKSLYDNYAATLFPIFHKGAHEYEEHYNYPMVTELDTIRMLKYNVGHFYGMHSDAALWDSTVRVLTANIYLSDDDMKGGELRFTQLDLELAPKKYEMVLFPAHPLYLHSSQKVLAGTKYVIGTFFYWRVET